MALDASQRADLAILRARLAAAAEGALYDVYAQANDELHNYIIRTCGNPYLQQPLERLRVLVKRTQHSTAFRHERFLDGNVEHLAIIDAILVGNGEVAEALMRMHVRKGTEMINDAISEGLA
jgi:DNA-binding GntR family transcriptional regulator